MSVSVALASWFCAGSQLGLAAQPSTPVASTSEKRVEMNLRCSSAERRAIQARLRPNLREFEFEVSKPGGPEKAPSGPTLARIWVDCSTPASIRLIISDGPRTQYYRRDFDLEHGLDSVALELLALVVQSSLESLAAGRPIGSGDSEPSASSLADDAAPDTVAEPSVVAEPDNTASGAPTTSIPNGGTPVTWNGHYNARMMASRKVLHGPGLGAQLEIGEGGTPLLVTVSGFAYWPLRVSREGLGAHLQVYEARSLLGTRIANEGDFSVAPMAGLGVWFMHVEPVAFGNGVPGEATELAAPFWTDSVVAHISVLTEWRLARLSVAIDLGAEFALSRVSFSLERDGRSEGLFTPWWVRPRLGTTLGF